MIGGEYGTRLCAEVQAPVSAAAPVANLAILFTSITLSQDPNFLISNSTSKTFKSCAPTATWAKARRIAWIGVCCEHRVRH